MKRGVQRAAKRGGMAKRDEAMKVSEDGLLGVRAWQKRSLTLTLLGLVCTGPRGFASTYLFIIEILIDVVHTGTSPSFGITGGESLFFHRPRKALLSAFCVLSRRRISQSQRQPCLFVRHDLRLLRLRLSHAF